jgi:hypothetical protein
MSYALRRSLCVPREALAAARSRLSDRYCVSSSVRPAAINIRGQAAAAALQAFPIAPSAASWCRRRRSYSSRRTSLSAENCLPSGAVRCREYAHHAQARRRALVCARSEGEQRRGDLLLSRKRGGGERRWIAQQAAQLIAQHYAIAGVEMVINPWVLHMLSRSFFTATRPWSEYAAALELRDLHASLSVSVVRKDLACLRRGGSQCIYRLFV